MKKTSAKIDKKKKVFYDKKTDSLWFFIKSGVEEEHKEIAPGISLELGKKGELLGIEVLDVSQTLKPLFESSQGIVSS